MTQATNNYHIVWYSPRGVVNEGMYLVGTDKGLAAYQGHFFSDNGTENWYPYSDTGTKADMLALAEKKVSADCKRHRDNCESYWRVQAVIVDDDGEINPYGN